jgi:hypothetical protein
MASRNADKKTSRQVWAEKRGIVTSDGVSSAEICTIVGGGRIGSLLDKATSQTTLLLGRGDAIPDASVNTGPIIVSTRNDALASIIEACPENRRKDLVFVQNGYLDDFLESKEGLADNTCTQVLLYVAVTAKDADPIDGVTSVNPEGLTAATGEHAEAFASLLHSLDLKCRVLTPEEYRPAMFEKLMYVREEYVETVVWFQFTYITFLHLFFDLFEFVCSEYNIYPTILTAGYRHTCSSASPKIVRQ